MKHIVLLGGDARMEAAGKAFRADGCTVFCLRLAEQQTSAALTAALQQADALILPIPAFDKDGRLCLGDCKGTPSWEALRQQLKPDCLLCGGRLQTVDWPRKLDFVEDEGFALANAVPTALAEGL